MRLVKRSKPGGKVDLDPSWIRWKNGVGPSDTTGKDCLTIQARFHCFRQSFSILMPSILSSGELWDSAPCSSGQMFVCQQSAKVSTTPEEIVPCEIFLKKRWKPVLDPQELCPEKDGKSLKSFEPLR